MINFLNLNKLTLEEPYTLYRKVIWIYVFLLIFEGALRKWLLPSLATPLLIVRDPIVIWFTYVGLSKGWLKNDYVKTMMIVSTISFVLTLMVGHQNLAVAFFGWRIYFFHFPAMFVMAYLLTKNDLYKICLFFLYLSIPMTILVVAQFYLPQEHWVNMGVGGDESGVGFGGAMGYFRPPGIFSFTSGYVQYQCIVGCCLLFFLLKNKYLEEKYRMSNIVMFLMMFCYVISVLFSLSRTLVFCTGIFVAFFLFGGYVSGLLRKRLSYLLLIVVLVFVVLNMSGLSSISLEVILTRFEQASESEGGLGGTIGNRYLGSFIRAFSGDVPIFGYGIGLGTNVGARIMSGDIFSFGFNGEEEWSRIMGECGIWGLFILAVRFILSLMVLKKSYFLLKKKNVFLPWIISANMVLVIANGQWAIPTNLGFAMFTGTMAICALKTNGFKL